MIGLCYCDWVNECSTNCSFLHELIKSTWYCIECWRISLCTEDTLLSPDKKVQQFDQAPPAKLVQIVWGPKMSPYSTPGGRWSRTCGDKNWSYSGFPPEIWMVECKRLLRTGALYLSKTDWAGRFLWWDRPPIQRPRLSFPSGMNMIKNTRVGWLPGLATGGGRGWCTEPWRQSFWCGRAWSWRRGVSRAGPSWRTLAR